MKPILLLILPILLNQQSLRNEQSKKPQTFYYFCVSHSVNPSSNKQVILYTEISKINCEESELGKQSKKWTSLVNENCKNQAGCTSDLNYYPTENDAKVKFQKMKERYADSKKFSLVKLELK